MKFVIIDINNLVHRAKHVVSNYDSFDECVGMVLTIVFNSMKKSYEKFKAEHCVACFDSRSWRKGEYPDWKGDRTAYSDKTDQEKEQADVIIKVLDDLKEFLNKSTNVTVLSTDEIEADDFVARWVQLHNDGEFKHVIVSADGDFKQLVTPNTDLYDPIRNTLYTSTGVYFEDGKRAGKSTPTIQKYGQIWKVKYNKKTLEPETFEPEWELFKVCIRGVKNNTKSAFPRVYETKMRTAFEDKGGLIWNNFINSTWGPEEARNSVRERYDLNKTLMDLRCQPDRIVSIIDDSINTALDKERKQMVGAHFARFCGKYNLPRLASNPNSIVDLLSSPYDA